MDLLMVRDRSTGRFVYTERLERRPGETSWEYVRRSVRRETRIRARFAGDAMQVIVGWNVDSVEEFLRSHPEYRLDGTTDGTMDGVPRSDGHDGSREGDGVDR